MVMLAWSAILRGWWQAGVATDEDGRDLMQDVNSLLGRGLLPASVVGGHFRIILIADCEVV